MNPRPLLLAAALASSWLAPNPSLAGSATAAARSDRIRGQIDALLAARRNPTPLPVDPPNPFAAASAGSVSPGAGGGGPDAASGSRPPEAPAIEADAQVLARLASRLRIGGLIRIKDQSQVVINDSPLREGDYFVAEREPRTIQLQVVRIAPGQLTLRLDEAELTVRF